MTENWRPEYISNLARRKASYYTYHTQSIRVSLKDNWRHLFI